MRRTSGKHPTCLEMPVPLEVTGTETLSHSWMFSVHVAVFGDSQLSSKQRKKPGASYAPSSEASLECMPQSATTPAEYQTIAAAQEQPTVAATALVEISNLANERLSCHVGRMRAHAVIPCGCGQRSTLMRSPTALQSTTRDQIQSRLWFLRYFECKREASFPTCVKRRGFVGSWRSASIGRAPCDNDYQTRLTRNRLADNNRALPVKLPHLIGTGVEAASLGETHIEGLSCDIVHLTRGSTATTIRYRSHRIIEVTLCVVMPPDFPHLRTAAVIDICATKSPDPASRERAGTYIRSAACGS